MINQLRKIAIFKQGLHKQAAFGKSQASCYKIIQQLSYIQIDTLAVVERAHHHSLWARLPNYNNELLTDLIQKRKIFEYWSHAAAYLPIEDYRFSLPKKSGIKRGDPAYFSKIDIKLQRHILDRIRIDGPLKARDFKSEKKNQPSWWNWKPEKQALEKLFMQGDLMISHRNGMEKVYALTENVLPSNISTTEPNTLELAAYLIDRSLNAHGFASLKQILHLRRSPSLHQAVKTVIQQKIESGSICKLSEKGLPELYANNNTVEAKISISSVNIHILSPFDNFLIHRDRNKYLFDFDYRLECYLPKPKRQFGYFSLPILYKSSLIGSLDCKAHREQSYLDVISLHINNISHLDDKFISIFCRELHRFAKFNNCSSIRVTSANPKSLKKRINAELGMGTK